MRESPQETKARAGKILRRLRKHYPDAGCTLDFGTVHQLLVATILSAQCTDERVNRVTPSLFERYRTVREFAEAEPRQLEQAVFATGLYVNKARAIRQSAQQLLDRHGGKVPRKLDDLVRLAGVGRKTASVILGAGYGLAEGIAVDTHVMRVSRRLGFTREKGPAAIEKELMSIIPRKDWISYSHQLIKHGRQVCQARTPNCGGCFLEALCPSARLGSA